MIKRFTATLILLAVFAAGYASAEVGKVSSRAYEQGISEMTWAVAACSLEDARAEKCFIPCSTDTDCLEKNGQTDH